MRTNLTFEDKYTAIVEKDQQYEGLFITAVKTTGIFCRVSCTARKPKKQNVIFYGSVNEAILNGYRPCKICKPMEPADATPRYIQSIMQELKDNPFFKIKDDDLKLRGIEPSKMRRWFKKHYNMTFQAYQRMLRMNTAFYKISNGESVTHTAYDIGFESLSGFNSTYNKVIGKAPSKAKKSVINIIRITTPLGPMFACSTDKGLCLLEFTNRRMLETEFKNLTHRLNAVILPGENKHLEQTKQQLKEYFDGKRTQFTIPLDTPGTEFQNQVWEALHHVPYGQTVSYQQQAKNVKRPKAVRAVASANGMNRIAIVVPCHRVIGKNGHLTGYAGGLERKKWLLDFERSNI